MCGLWGAISRTLTPLEMANVSILADLSKYRGRHSTGISIINRTKKGTRFSIMKEAIPSTFFMASKAVYEHMKDPDPVMVMGHCRHATVGAINRTNAHPLHKGHIIGCHNGTVHKFAPVKKDEEVTSDSHKIFELIRDHGIDHTIEEVGHDGAYALTWVDTKLKTLNIVRNSDRDLYFIWNTTHNTLYWASDQLYLEFMNNESSTGFGFPVKVETMRHYTVDYGSGREIRLESRPLTIKKPKPKYESFMGDTWGGMYGFGAMTGENWDDYGSSHCKECKKPWLQCEGHDEAIDNNPSSPPWKEEKKTTLLLPGSKTNGKKYQGAFCKACRKKYIGGCKCKGAVKPYYPPEWQINDAGEWVGADEGGKPTSVPAVGPNTPKVKRYPGWCKEDTYVGYRQEMLTPSAAGALLMTSGCTVCEHMAELEDTVWFYTPTEYFCSKCYDKPEMHDIRGNRSTWKSKLVKASEGSKHVH